MLRKKILTVIMLGLVIFGVQTAFAGVFFSDGFESGGLSQKDPVSGAGWRASNHGPLDSVSISSEKAHTGSYSLKFHYHGDPNLSADAWAEQRYQTGQPQTDWYLRYYIYFPSNFDVRDALGADNDKIATVWGVDYKRSQVVFNMEMGKNQSVGFKLKRITTYPYDVLECSGKIASGQNSPRWTLTNAYKGRWICFEFHYKIDDGTGNGQVQLFVDGDLKISMDNLAFVGAPCSPGYMLNGYLMGWANSGFTKDTNIYIDDVVFSSHYIGLDSPNISAKPQIPVDFKKTD